MLYFRTFMLMIGTVLFLSQNSISDEGNPLQIPRDSKAINVNPDPNGEPWYAGGVPFLTAEETMKRMQKISELDFSNRSISLPYKVDNSQTKYFRPIFRQQGGSCAQASGIAYQFTYEVNFEQKSSAKLLQNQFPSHYTWNLLNGGIGNGSLSEDGWYIVKANGCPTLATFGGITGDDTTNTKWMNGYTKYLSGMNYRVKSINRITITTPQGLNTLKQWIFDHGEGLQIGGLATFYTLVWDSTGKLVPLDTLAKGTEEAGKVVITKWGSNQNSGHAMTIVGYNDSIRFDYNKDGKFTNTIDINADGKIDLKDWEIGAYKVANTWGTIYGDSGFFYMMYKVGAQPIEEGGLTNFNNVLSIRALIDEQTKLTYKFKLKHTIRSKINISIGISTDTSNASKPEFILHPDNIFQNQGGDFPMEGKFMNDEIEVGLDANKLLPYLSGKAAKFFLLVNSTGGSGRISSFSLIEYRNLTNILEEKCKDQFVDIPIGLTQLSITYQPKIADLIIETAKLPPLVINQPFSVKLQASGGKPPYAWSIVKNRLNLKQITETYPAITTKPLKPNNMDDGFSSQKLDFPFPFYGDTFKTVYITTDGSILFDSTFQYIRTAAAVAAQKCITPFGADLTFEMPGDSMYYDGNQEYAIFRWKTTKFWGKDDRVTIDFAVKLYPSGKINFFYNKGLTKGIDNIAYGISYGNKDDFTLLEFASTSQIPENYAVQFMHAVPPKGLTCSPDGTLSGIPIDSANQWNFTVACVDSMGIKKMKNFILSTSTAISHPTMSVSAVGGINYYTVGSKIMLSYSLLRSTHVRIDILTVQGKIVHTLLNTTKQAGTYTALWNLTNSGKSIVPGVYCVKLSLDKQSMAKKFIYMK